MLPREVVPSPTRRGGLLLCLSALLLVVVVIVVAAFTYVVGPLDSVPRKRASATSPDGALTVEVFKQRLAVPEVTRGNTGTSHRSDQQTGLRNNF
jgi:uncharacterized membrane protein